jgi:hypothetical protein
MQTYDINKLFKNHYMYIQFIQLYCEWMSFMFTPFVRFMETSLEKGVCHIMALPFTLISILRQKENYENSNISPCKNIIF